MSERRIGIIMNGVTGRMGRNQHLMFSIAAIRREGASPCPKWISESRGTPRPSR